MSRDYTHFIEADRQRKMKPNYNVFKVDRSLTMGPKPLTTITSINFITNEPINTIKIDLPSNTNSIKELHILSTSYLYKSIYATLQYCADNHLTTSNHEHLIIQNGTDPSIISTLKTLQKVPLSKSKKLYEPTSAQTILNFISNNDLTVIFHSTHYTNPNASEYDHLICGS